MTIATLEQLKEQLGFTDDLGSADDDLMTRKLEAAQNHIERLLGFRIATSFGGEGQEAIPPSLVEAVLMLAAFWYAEREAATNSTREVPFGVREIILEYREWSF
ncbi:head-tail connector protein [Thioclava sp. GXIMD4215]|uniref:head-tail connector protein n=1 Tax=Thioclava sp. GXIMD4215 TaxID=3131928 RepID=UPI003253F2DC